MQDTVGPTDSQSFHSLFLLFCWKMVSTQNLRPLDICPGFLDVLQVSQGIRSSEITAMSAIHIQTISQTIHFWVTVRHCFIYMALIWVLESLGSRVQGPKEKPRILPLMVPERKGNGTAPVQSTGPKGLHYSVSAIVCLRVIFRRKLYFDLCSQRLYWSSPFTGSLILKPLIFQANPY